MKKNWNKKYFICLITLVLFAGVMFFCMEYFGDKVNAKDDMPIATPKSRNYLIESDFEPYFENDISGNTFQWLGNTLCNVNYKLVYLHALDVGNDAFYQVSQYDDMYLSIVNKKIMLRTFMKARIIDNNIYYNYSYEPRYSEKDGLLLPGVYEISSLNNENEKTEFVVTEAKTLESALYELPMLRPDCSAFQFSILTDGKNADYENAIRGYYNWTTNTISVDTDMHFLPTYAYHLYNEEFDTHRLLVRKGNTIVVAMASKDQMDIEYYDDFTSTFVIQEDTMMSDIIKMMVDNIGEVS